MTSRREPLRYQVARDFIEAAKDLGCADTIAAARRVYNAMTGMGACPEDDKALFRAWQNA